MTVTKNVSNYNDVLLVSQSSLGIRSVFSLHSVAVLFYVLLVLRQAEFISASGFRNKFAVTGWDVKGTKFLGKES
ncbi:MAG: hypothetical protein UHW86_07145 [Spirochaetota bacterium]|nr:hypothetical protein [Spirochaetota bacterium]